MRRFLPLLILLLGAWAYASAPARGKPGEKIVVITNVNIVEVETGAVRTRLAVVIKKGRITAIAKRAIIEENPQIVIVNGEGKYLIPGLWDMRIRLDQGTGAERAKNVTVPLLLANGVTGVRDAGGDPAALKELRRQIEQGEVPGPRMVMAATPDERVLVVHDLAEARAAVGALHQRPAAAGVVAGTDSPPGVAPGFALHRELELLVEAGLTPLQALQTATINPVRSLGKEKELGQVEVDKMADLVLLDGDPTQDIRNLDKIAGVVAAGRYYSRRELDAMLAQAQAAADQDQQ
ncbi:MAG TPA: amidohydrolase family protein [Terriglobales bacterium]|nr:amidohydrolase family protein [Terriglobales bacterium]